MPEHIPGLDHFTQQAKESEMLSAQEVRRRGDRRRRNRRIGVAAGGLALAVVAGIGLWQTPLVDGMRPPDDAVPLPADPSETTPGEEPSRGMTEEPPSESPTPSEPEETPADGPSEPATGTPTVPPPTWGNVPVAEEVLGGGSPGGVGDEYTDLSAVDLGLCAPAAFGSPGTTLARDYAYEGYDPSVSAVVLGFDSADEASAVFDVTQQAALDCASAYEAEGLTDARVDDASDDLEFDAGVLDAEIVQAGYSTTAGVLPDDEFGMGLWTTTLVVQADERVLFLTSNFEGMDNNCIVSSDGPEGQCTFAANLPAMLERLTS